MFKLDAKIVGLSLAALLAATPALAQPPMSPEAFVNAAAQSDQYEIQAGRLIVAQSENPRVKAFAQDMIDTHTKTSIALKAATAASRLPPPPETLGNDQSGMLSALQSAKGPDLDRTYAVQQVNAHTAALVTQQAYASQGSDPNLRETAQDAVPVIQHHLEMARQMNDAVGGDK